MISGACFFLLGCGLSFIGFFVILDPADLALLHRAFGFPFLLLAWLLICHGISLWLV